MQIVLGIIIFIIGMILFGIVYQLVTALSGFLMMASMGMGYGIGKMFKIKPKSQSQGGVIMGINSLLQVGMQLGLSVWALLAFIGFTSGWEVQAYADIAGTVFWLCLFADLLIVFIIGLTFGRVLFDNEEPQVDRLGNLT